MTYYDIHVEIAEAESAVKRAKLLGFSGIALMGTPDKSLIKEDGFDIVSAIILKAKTVEELKSEIDKFRSKVEILAVHGGIYEINRAACEDARVDLLCHPERGRIDSGLDHICTKAAAENGVALEINFGELLNSRSRPKQIYFMQRNIYLCNKYGAKLITTSGASDIWEMRAPRELASIANVLGLDIGLAIDSVSTIPGEKVLVNREKLSGSRIGGVKVIGDTYGKS